ncbi:RNA polymerase sigma factor [Amycolatopsis benzoatilytica]|uniref:RNA polymerase sigma factor n=1 Tax=Amycolatopsis benzoatilytica TaxID=346045 RepID=UPI00037D5133|nr:RNA polymerase sigma factor [Amycolatopsis benzoatilytica]
MQQRRWEWKPEETWSWVHAAQDGDSAGFELIYRHYSKVLIAYFLGRPFDLATAEDLTSETFVRALRAIRDVRYQGKDVGSWLLTIARNLAFDYWKSSRYRREIAVSEDVDLERAVDGPERRVLAALDLDEVSTRLTALSAEQRQCLLLRRVHGYSVTETASMMSRSEAAIRQLNYRAVRQLVAAGEG